MSDEARPTIEEAVKDLRHALRERPEHSWTTVSCESLFTLLESHASTTARVKEAVRLMKPFAAHSDDDPDPTRSKRMAFLPISDLRALAAFVSNNGAE